MTRKFTICGSVLSLMGLALLAVGIAVKWSIFPKVLEDQVYENIKLEDGTEGWKAFVSLGPFKRPLMIFDVISGRGGFEAGTSL